MHSQDPGPSAWKFHLRAETSDPWESCSDTIHFQNEGTPETCPREDHLKTVAGICIVQTWTELCYCWATRRWVLEVHRKLPMWGTNFLQPSTTASCKHHDPASHCATCQSLHGLRGSVPELESTVTPPWTPWMQRLFFRSISNKGHDFMNKACTGTMITSICWKTQAFAFPSGHGGGYIGDPTSWTRSLVLSGSGSRLQGKILSRKDL